MKQFSVAVVMEGEYRVYFILMFLILIYMICYDMMIYDKIYDMI
jgi:hypothetical protein